MTLAYGDSRVSCGAFEKVSFADRVPERLVMSYDRDWVLRLSESENVTVEVDGAGGAVVVVVTAVAGVVVVVGAVVVGDVAGAAPSR